MVLLDDEPVADGARRPGVVLGHRLGRAPRVAPAAVLVQGHSGSVVTGTDTDRVTVMTVPMGRGRLDVRGVPVEDTFDP
ncbi:hypothetical protein GCM10009629_46260 [Pseudonocardia alni]